MRDHGLFEPSAVEKGSILGRRRITRPLEWKTGRRVPIEPFSLLTTAGVFRLSNLAIFIH